MGKVKSSKVSGTGTRDVYMPTWKWFTALDFLRDSISPVKTKPTPGVPVVSIDEGDEETVEPKSDTGVDEEEGDLLGTRKLPSQLPKQNKIIPRTWKLKFCPSHLCCLRVQQIRSAHLMTMERSVLEGMLPNH